MGRPFEHTPVKLIVGLISHKASYFDFVKHTLENKFGAIDNESCLLDFSCTHYYEKEFGKDLWRKFFSFKKLISLRKNYCIKLYTNKIEQKFSKNNKRLVNIDPGYISLTKLVLFTTKNRSHRIYLDRGIYADAELWFTKGTFQPFLWTYPDYKTKRYIDFFNSVRASYINEVRRYL